jgi:hypothetical protein
MRCQIIARFEAGQYFEGLVLWYTQRWSGRSFLLIARDNARGGRRRATCYVLFILTAGKYFAIFQGWVAYGICQGRSNNSVQ